MPTIDKFCAPGLFDPPTYSQGIKVTQAQTILFLSGQVAYMPDGTAAFRGDFKAQARGAYDAITIIHNETCGKNDSQQGQHVDGEAADIHDEERRHQ